MVRKRSKYNYLWELLTDWKQAHISHGGQYDPNAHPQVYQVNEVAHGGHFDPNARPQVHQVNEVHHGGAFDPSQPVPVGFVAVNAAISR